MRSWKRARVNPSWFVRQREMGKSKWGRRGALSELPLSNCTASRTPSSEALGTEVPGGRPQTLPFRLFSLPFHMSGRYVPQACLSDDSSASESSPPPAEKPRPSRRKAKPLRASRRGDNDPSESLLGGFTRANSSIDSPGFFVKLWLLVFLGLRPTRIQQQVGIPQAGLVHLGAS